MSQTLVRNFSRQGVELLRLSQEGGTVIHKGSNLIMRGAILMSCFGVGLSMFSVSQLQDSRKSPVIRLFSSKGSGS